MNQETKLGLFVLLALTCLVTSIILLGDFQFQRHYSLNVIFSDVAGLPVKAKVKIAGVEVGTVKKIALVGNEAKATVWINYGVQIHSDAKANIVSTGIIGSKFLELTIGSENSPLLNDGDTIKGTSPMTIEKVMSAVMDKLDTVFGMFDSDDGKNMGKNLASTIKNLKDITGSLHKAIYDKEEELSETMDNIHSFTGDMADMTADNRENIKVAIKEIREASEKFNRILAKVDQSEGTIGKLLTDKEMGEDLKATFKELKEDTQEVKKVLHRMNHIETYWSYDLRYDTKQQYSHSDLGLKIAPRPGKYYYIGISNIGDNTSGTTDIETKNTFNLLYGLVFDTQTIMPVELYAGAIRSKGGVGIRVKPLSRWSPMSRLELTAEAFDFSRTLPVAKVNANVGARVKLNNWAFIGAQMEDIYNTSNVNAYMKLEFRDDDIAYILGVVGLAKP